MDFDKCYRVFSTIWFKKKLTLELCKQQQTNKMCIS